MYPAITNSSSSFLRCCWSRCWLSNRRLSLFHRCIMYYIFNLFHDGVKFCLPCRMASPPLSYVTWPSVASLYRENTKTPRVDNFKGDETLMQDIKTTTKDYIKLCVGASSHTCIPEKVFAPSSPWLQTLQCLSSDINWNNRCFCCIRKPDAVSILHNHIVEWEREEL